MSCQFVAVGVLTKSPGERSRAGRWSWALIAGWTVLLQLVVPQQLLTGQCLCDSAPHSC